MLSLDVVEKMLTSARGKMNMRFGSGARSNRARTLVTGIGTSSPAARNNVGTGLLQANVRFRWRTPGLGWSPPPGPIATTAHTRGSLSGVARTVQPSRLCPAKPIRSASMRSSALASPVVVASGASKLLIRNRTSGTRLPTIASMRALRMPAVSPSWRPNSFATTSE